MAPSASEASATGVIARRGRRRAFGGPPRPPRDGDGDGGGGGGGDDHGGFAAAGGPGDVGPFALGLALTGITTLFFVLIAVWLFLRRPAPDWHPASAPRALWLSTLFLAASSLAVERAARAARAERAPRRDLLALHGRDLARPVHAARVRALAMFVRDKKELRILLLVVAGFVVGFGLLIFLIATDV